MRAPAHEQTLGLEVIEMADDGARDGVLCARAEEVLDVGGDRRPRDPRVERLKSVVAGLAAGVLAYVGLAHGLWLTDSSGRPAPAPVDTPARYPSAPGSSTVSPPHHGRVVPSRCPVRVRDPRVRRWVCFGSSDAATYWLDEQFTQRHGYWPSGT